MSDNPYTEFLKLMRPHIEDIRQRAYLRGKTDGIAEAHALFRRQFAEWLKEAKEHDKRTGND